MELDNDTSRLHRTLLALADSALLPNAVTAAPESYRATLERLLHALVREAPPRPYQRWINAAAGQMVRLIKVDDVLYFQADTKYTRVVTADSEALIRKPLKELQDELAPPPSGPSTARPSSTPMRSAASRATPTGGCM